MMGPALTKADAAALRLECVGLASQRILRQMLVVDPEEATTACGEVREKTWILSIPKFSSLPGVSADQRHDEKQSATSA